MDEMGRNVICFYISFHGIGFFLLKEVLKQHTTLLDENPSKGQYVLSCCDTTSEYISEYFIAVTPVVTENLQLPIAFE